jgi:hypothetical protein
MAFVKSVSGAHRRSMLSMAVARFSLAGLLLGAGCVSALAGRGASAKGVLDAGFAPVHVALEASGGLLDTNVRSAYVDWEEKTILQRLRDAGQPVPADCIAEVESDPTLRDAVFAAIDPPDPSILQNYCALRTALGAGFVARYRALVIADAVAKRISGVCPPAAPVQVTTPSPAREQDPLVDDITAYIRQTGTSTLQLFEDPQAQDKLTVFLQARKLDPALISKIGRTNAFHNVLKRVLITLGERPAQRDPTPDSADWLRYLSSIYESKVDNQSGTPPPWPRFPMAVAPWPLLMPLAHAYPLREAGYIWAKYEGHYGTQRMHTYGPYEMPSTEWPRELQPSVWYWSAWPDVTVHGGECTVMAPMAVENNVALGVPAMMAGQPGHCNLMVFKNAGPLWYTAIEQAFAGGPDVTYGAWLFKEIGTAPGLGKQNNAAWASADYHLGLAQSMNVGLRQYMDTRIAVNLYHHLAPAEGGTLGRRLLTQATETNPFNPAPWYLLGTQTRSVAEAIAMVSQVMQASQAADTSAETIDAAPPKAGASPTPAAPALPKPVAGSQRSYWRVLEESLTRRTVLKYPTPKDKLAAQMIYTFLQTVPGISTANEASYVVATSEPGEEAVKLQNMIQEHVAGSKKSRKKGVERDFAAELKSYVALVGEEQGVAFLDQLEPLLSQAPPNDPYLLILRGVETKLSASHS